MRTTTFIYVLNDPRDGRVRYVGKSDNPHKRWIQHCIKLGSRTHKVHWIQELKSLGLKPELEILEEVPVAGWEAVEREYIRVFRMVGMNLTNNTDGGEGSSGILVSRETRERIGKASKGRIVSEETRAKISITGRGKKRSPEQRLKQSIRMSGSGHPLFGKKASEETRRKMSLARKGKQTGADNPMFGKSFSEEARAKMSVASLGKKKSPETRARMVAAWVIRKAKLTPQT